MTRLIDADALINALGISDEDIDFKEILEDAPTIDAEPVRHGEWVESKIPNELYVCSNCGGACWSYDYERTIVKSNFCPNCGAKMRGSKILGKEAECIIDEANAYRGEEMTREEAIDCLEGLKIYLKTEHIDQEAVDIAIEALQREEHLVELEAKAVAIIKSERHGEWEEKETHLNEGDCEITEWQSARCSKCGKYHTTPYMYYFDNFNFCPNCGAKMDGGTE